MSRAVGVKRPQEAQEAKALWKMKAAKDGGEEFCDPERKETFWEEMERDWHCGKSTSQTQFSDFRRILEARDEKVCAIFDTFSSDGPSDFLVVSSTRWDKHQRRLNAPWRQNSSTSSGRQWQAGLEEQRVAWSSSGKKGHGGSGRLPGKMCRYESGNWGLGALDGASRRRGFFKVHPAILDERR